MSDATFLAGSSTQFRADMHDQYGTKLIFYGEAK